MNYPEKFNLIIETVEENLKNQNADTKDILVSMENRLGMSRRAIGDSFRFLTDITLGDYIRLRNLTVAFTEKLDTNTSWSEVSYQSGYSEESAFQRAFKKAFGITPAYMEKSGDYSKLMQRLSLEDVTKGKQMQEIIEFEKSENNIKGLEERVDAELEKNDYVDTLQQMAHGLCHVEYCMDLLNEECRLSKLAFGKAIEVVSEVDACASIFGLDVEHVLLIYELLKDKNSIYSACDLFAQYYKDLALWELDDKDFISVYFTINFGYDKCVATELAKILNGSLSYLNTLSYEYITMYVKHILSDEDDISYIDIIPFPLYTKLKSILHNRINYQNISVYSSWMYDKYMLDMEYKQECSPFWDYNFVQPDEKWIEACDRLLKYMGYGNLIKYNKNEELSETDVNAMLLVIHHKLNYKLAEAIAKNIIPFIKDMESFESGYIDFIARFGDKVTCELNMEHYLKFTEIVEKFHEITNPEFLSIKDLKDSIDGLDYAFKSYIESKRVGMLRKKYNMHGHKVWFAEKICNRFVKQEEAYQLVSTNYNNGLQDQLAIFLSPEEKLAIILSLNTKRDIHICEEEIKMLFEGIKLDDDLMRFYVRLNEIASQIRTTEDFKLISVADFLKIKGTITFVDQNNSNILKCIVEHLLKTDKTV